jgi:hypothetical protein
VEPDEVSFVKPDKLVPVITKDVAREAVAAVLAQRSAVEHPTIPPDHQKPMTTFSTWLAVALDARGSVLPDWTRLALPKRPSDGSWPFIAP